MRVHILLDGLRQPQQFSSPCLRKEPKLSRTYHELFFEIVLFRKFPSLQFQKLNAFQHDETQFQHRNQKRTKLQEAENFRCIFSPAQKARSHLDKLDSKISIRNNVIVFFK